jgi:murein DD-endopeptidase MepM/ murein hydrolase activator NlpD
VNAIDIALPVRGRWTVMWGGDTLALNHHVEVPSQRRAADLVIVGDSGRTFRSDGKNAADYYAYGQEVRAVADGTVVTAVDGVPDNTPGLKDTYFVPGNVVIVQHGPTLFSVYSHLQPGSQRVARGARVKRGDTLGLCGNSGNTSEPHLHFQLQDGPRLESAWGVEALFKHVRLVRGGKMSSPEAYRFLKGDVIEEAR